MSNIPKNQQEVLEFAAQGELEDDLLVMPTLWSLDRNGRYHWWQLYIGIAYDGTDPVNNPEDRIPVEQDEIERGDIDEESGARGVYWTQYAQEGGAVQTSAPSFIASGKNIGRKNYTTPFTQAILDARKLYNLRIKKGNVLDKTQLIADGDAIEFTVLMEMTHRGEFPWRVNTMAIHDYNKGNNARHIVFPCDLQPKYDGTQCVVVYHPDLPLREFEVDDEIVELPIDIYSRQKETYEGQDHIVREIYELIMNAPESVQKDGMHIIGELYKHGLSLQNISGTSRRKADSKRGKAAILMDFMAFDCFYVDRPDMVWTERKDTLQTLFDSAEKNSIALMYVSKVPVTQVENKDELEAVYRSYLDEGFEGGVVRNFDSRFEVGLAGERRSYKTQKIKPRFDAEWPLVGYTHGERGKAVNFVVWEFAENDDGVRARLNLTAGAPLPDLQERIKFTADMNAPEEVRSAIYTYLSESGNFQELLYGKLMTITYSIASDDGLPQQPKAIRFRDPAVTEELYELAGIV